MLGIHGEAAQAGPPNPGDVMVPERQGANHQGVDRPSTSGEVRLVSLPFLPPAPAPRSEDVGC